MPQPEEVRASSTRPSQPTAALYQAKLHLQHTQPGTLPKEDPLPTLTAKTTPLPPASPHKHLLSPPHTLPWWGSPKGLSRERQEGGHRVFLFPGGSLGSVSEEERRVVHSGGTLGRQEPHLTARCPGGICFNPLAPCPHNLDL